MSNTNGRKAELEKFLSEFFQSYLDVTIYIRNILHLCRQFEIPDSEWIALASKISDLPWARERNLSITEAQMKDARTVDDIATRMLAGPGNYPPLSKVVVKKGAIPRTRAPLSFELKVRLDDIPSETVGLDNIEYPVWYGTNRAYRNSGNAGEGFSSERDTIIHYGTCRVFVPKSHKIGSVGSSFFRRIITMTDDRLKLLAIEELQQAYYWEQLSSKLKATPLDQRQAVIFLHGYNVAFEDAAIRAAQIGFDLNIRGVMAFFSWPSQGTLAGYAADEATIEASEGAITEYLIQFVEKCGIDRVHIVAHSMGNRGLLRSIQRIADRAHATSGKFFDQIILAAPDVDADVFRQLCSAYARVSRSSTLYVSQKDRAVNSSRWLHRFPRVGFAPPIFVAPGIDTINVTNVDVTLLGHGYVAEARDVLRDMHDLLTNRSPPASRFGLRLTEVDNGRYWVIGA